MAPLPKVKLRAAVSLPAAVVAGLGISVTKTNGRYLFEVVPSELPLNQFAPTTSAQLAELISDETGTGSLVFGDAPHITTPTGIVKDDVGLSDVDNTSDAAKWAVAATLTNKTIDLGGNSVTGTIAEFNAALSDGDFATLAGAETLTNKTLISPAITTPTGLVKGDVGLGNVDNTSDATKWAAVATLTNKTLTAPVISSPTGLVKADVGLGNVDNTSDATKWAATATLTNKTFDTAGTGNALKINGTAVSDKTGTGKVVLDTAPTLTNPVVGTQTAGDNSTKAASTAFVQAAISASGGGDMLSTNNLSDVANTATARKNLAGASRSVTGSDTVVASDIGKTLLLNSSSAFTLAVTAAATLGNGFWCDLRNVGTALVTLDPNSSETVDGKTTLTIGLGEAMRVFCDGTALYTDASRGKLVELARVTNPNAAQVDFDFASGWPADFDEFEIRLVDVTPATDDVYLGMRVKTTASLTVQTSGYVYVGVVQGQGGGGNVSSTLDSISDRIPLTRAGSIGGGNGIGNGIGESANLIVLLNAPNSTQVKQARFGGSYIRSDGVAQSIGNAIGNYGSNTSWTGVRLFMSSGNILNGSIVLYGRRK